MLHYQATENERGHGGGGGAEEEAGEMDETLGCQQLLKISLRSVVMMRETEEGGDNLSRC